MSNDLLSRVQTGIVDRPIALVVHGGPGVGKSTFAAGAPDPFFIDADNRTAHLNVRRVKPEAWEEVLDVFRLAAKGELKCKTLVLDTIDQAELLMHRDLAASNGVATIEEVGGGYGKGYVVALNEWRRLGVAIDAVRSKGIGVILLAHSQVKTFKNPTGEDYDRWELKLDKRAHNFLRERVDGVGFAEFETVTVKTKDGRTKAKGSGKATLRFSPSPAFESKRFSAFPDNCALEWPAFENGRG
jgi:hypothetical protein